MLRRVLIPFSELFILLTLMFLTLFFVSAALGGRGLDRPSDAVHLIKVSTTTFTSNGESTNVPWPGGGSSMVAIADQANFADQRWASFWAYGLSSRADTEAVQWRSVRFDGHRGECISLADATGGQGVVMNLEDANAAPRDENRFEPILGELPGIGPRLTAYADLSVLAGTALDPPDDQQQFVTATVSVAYRPNDIQNAFVLMAGLNTNRPARWSAGTVPPMERTHLRFSHIDLSSGAEAHGTLTMGSRRQSSWQTNGTARPAPAYYSQPGCRGVATARLFVSFSSTGATASPVDPRIQHPRTRN